jgi:hypothetical protein
MCPFHFQEICRLTTNEKGGDEFFKLDEETNDPPINISSQNLIRKSNGIPPFYVSLVMNGFRINNCMIDSGASTTVMPIGVFQQLGLGISRSYGNVCGMDSKAVKVFSVAKDVDTYLYHLPKIRFPTDIVVVDVPPAWGMLLSRDWANELGGYMNLDFSHAFIPMGDGTYEVLYSQPESQHHVCLLNGTDATSDDEFDRVSNEPPYDASELPFANEEAFEVLFPRTNKYDKGLVRHYDKDVGEVKILQNDEQTQQTNKQQIIKSIQEVAPPPELYIEDDPHIEYGEGNLVLLWDKKRGEPNYDPKDEILWVGPFIVKNKENNLYNVFTMTGRKVPVGYEASRLCPYIDGT